MIFYQQAVGNHGGGLRNLPTTSVQVTGQTLSGANVERHALPAPGIDFQLQGRECFDLRVLGDAVFVAVAAELPADEFFASMGGIAFSTLTFSSRTDSLSMRTGGSMARFDSTWNKWFCTTSRIVPVWS